MNKSISVLVIDDSDDRVDYIISRFREACYEPFVECIHNAKAFKSALSGRKWHMVIANPDMRDFNVSKILRLLQDSVLPMPPLILMPKTSCLKGTNDQELWPGFLPFLAGFYLEKNSYRRAGFMVDVTGDNRDSYANTDDLSGHCFKSLKHSNELLRQIIDSRKITEKMVKESEERFRALILNAYDLIISTEEDGTIIYMSPSSEMLLGTAPETFFRTNLFIYFHPLDAERAKKLRHDFIRQYGKSMEVEFRIKHSNGDWVHFEGIVTNLLHRPSIRAIVINARDVTHQKKREKEREEILSQLRESIATTKKKTFKLKGVIDSLPIPLMIYDKDNKISLANEASKVSLGFDPKGMDQSDILTKVFSRLITGEKTHVEDTVSKRAVKGEIVKGIKYLFHTPSEDERVALCSAFPIRFQGEIINTVVLWEDITDRESLNKALKQARDDLEKKVVQRTVELTETIDLLKQEIQTRQEIEKQLQYSNELMKKIFSNEHILIAYMDTGFNFIKVNEAYARADSHKPEFYPGKNHFRLFPNEENERIFHRVVMTGKPYTVYAKPFKYSRNPERGVSYWDWSLQPVKNESGMVEGIILFLVNVTKRVEAEKNMTRMQTELIRSEHLSEIGKLASTMAHELRNPLAVIETACFNISHKNRDPALEKNLANIEECLEESNQIINNLLFYARRGLPSNEMFPICDLLGECIEQAKKRYRTSKVRIKKRCTLQKDIRMEADPLQMKELFGNILSNALDAIGKEEGKISVSVVLENNSFIRFSFKDNGPGIRKEDLEKVQNPFFSTKSKGTGLGLAVCRQIVDLHDGRIKIKSKEGEGTTVTLTLPLRKGI
ncbi:MAG: PAS domain S-box protein [bacterium]